MRRTFLTVVSIILLNVLAGCESADSGRGQLVAGRPATAISSAAVTQIPNARESDLVEQVATNRQAYQRALESLVDYYTETGNHMKLTWARKELEAFDTMAQYNYIIEASVAGPDLKASESILEADYLFKEAAGIEKKAGLVIKNARQLRRALEQYNEVIRRFPSSDKIGDAAYKAGGIYEHFKDYKIALLYYQRAYQWDAETSYPARFKEAYILDKQFHDRAKALAAYRQALKALKHESEHRTWRVFAEQRITELTKSDESGT